MAASHLSSRNFFDGLPDDSLGIIGGHLGVKDRVRFLSCCKAVRRYQLSSPHSLFSELTFDMRSAQLGEQLLMWLVRVKQQVGSLSLSWGSGNEEVSAMTLLLLGALADSSLHTLDVDVTGRVRLGGWLAALRCLRSLRLLSIIADQMEVVVGLSSLTSLTGLVLTSRRAHTVIPPGALPPALEALSVNKFDAASMGQALQAAGPLRQLKLLLLGHPNEPWLLETHWDALAAHTQLTTLALDSWQLRGVPHQLGALTALQALGLTGAELGGNEASLEVLTSLTQLSKLFLPRTGLLSVPASVLALPELQELDLSINSLAGPIPITRSTNLTRLDLDTSLALTACEGFTALSALRMLGLVGPPVAYRIDYEDVGRLIHNLSRLPDFAELNAALVGGDPNPFSMAKKVLLGMRALPFTILDQ